MLSAAYVTVVQLNLGHLHSMAAGRQGSRQACRGDGKWHKMHGDAVTSAGQATTLIDTAASCNNHAHTLRFVHPKTTTDAIT